MRFDDLHLIDPLLRAVKDKGYTEPTPIQNQAIPILLGGRDLIGLAQTGTGKTAAFALPVLQQLVETTTDRHPKKRRWVRVLVIAPTRELVSQISESFEAYGKYTNMKHMTIFGGVSQRPQETQLKRGVDIVVATPGRLMDLMNQGVIRLNHVEYLILDEADRMLDMGFLPDIRRIVADLPTERQTLLFSATMPPDIQKLSHEILIDPATVEVARESTTAEAVDQLVFFVERNNKRKLLEHLLEEYNMHRTLVFTRTKHGANRLSEQLAKAKIPVDAIHGNKSHRARETALDKFKRGKVQVLVATDVVARGIDVDDISHVVNFDLPNETESYVHRIGRTGRAGADGIALSFCASGERRYLRDIERLIQMNIPVITDHPFPSEQGVPQPTVLEGEPRRSPDSANGSGKGKPSRSNRSGKPKYRSNKRRESGESGERSSSENGSRPTGNRKRKPSNRRNGSANSANGGASANNHKRRQRNNKRHKPTPQS